jgi:hypothetical protein
MNVIRAKSALNNKPIWIWLEHVTCMTANDKGGAVLHLVDGTAYAITDSPEEVLATAKKMLNA